MAEPVDAPKPPEELIRELERYVVAADMAGMAEIIPQWRAHWGSISEPMRREILTLEAIFLTMVNARAKPASSPDPGSSTESRA